MSLHRCSSPWQKLSGRCLAVPHGPGFTQRQNPTCPHLPVVLRTSEPAARARGLCTELPLGEPPWRLRPYHVEIVFLKSGTNFEKFFFSTLLCF